MIPCGSAAFPDLALPISTIAGIRAISGRNQPQQPRDGICVYDRPNYEGRSECWNQGQNISDLARQGNWSGQISSIRLFGRSVAVVYQDTGYRGESLTVDRDIPDLAAIRETRQGKRKREGSGKREKLRKLGPSNLFGASSGATPRQIGKRNKDGRGIGVTALFIVVRLTRTGAQCRPQGRPCPR